MVVDPAQSLLCLRADLEAIQDEIKYFGWRIQPWPVDDLTVFVTMTSAVDLRAWTLRLVCQNYPDEPPSIKCVNPQTKDPSDSCAWPQCEGFRPTSDLCMNISREGLMQLHPGWQQSGYRWITDGNPIHCVLLSIQFRLDDPSKYKPKG
jgi:hypothetical protein